MYQDRQFNWLAAKILPGEFYWSAQDMAIITMLGFCFSACIREKLSGIGGMSHLMLPCSGDGDNPASVLMRYGTHAMEILMKELLKAGARREHLAAKAFGG